MLAEGKTNDRQNERPGFYLMFIKRILQFGAGVLISGLLAGGISGCSPTKSSAKEPSSTGSDTMAESKHNEKIGEPRVTRQVLIQIERGAAIKPQVIVQADDGGFIIAGGIDATKQGWAAKTDAEGKVLWHYFRDLQEEDKEAFKKQLPVRPIFNGVVAMPDGSIYLSGSMPRRSGSDAPNAFLTHLDANGRLLSEKFIIPEKEDNKGVKGGFIGCVRWGDGFAVIGGAGVPKPWVRPTETKVKEPRHASEGWYWVLMFDGTGKKKWERFIPRSLSDHMTISKFMHVTNSNLMFSVQGYDDTKFSTEIFSVSVTGEVVAKNMIKGDYQFVCPVVPDDIVQLYGRRPGGASTNSSETDRRVVITLDEQLNEIHSTQEGLENFYGYEFRKPDQSIVSIGDKKHTSGQRYTSRVVHVDQFLQNERYVELPHNRRPFGVAGDMAANFTKNPNEFVVVRQLMVVTDGKLPDDIPADFKVGAELDFIQIQ